MAGRGSAKGCTTASKLVPSVANAGGVHVYTPQVQRYTKSAASATLMQAGDERCCSARSIFVRKSHILGQGVQVNLQKICTVGGAATNQCSESSPPDSRVLGRFSSRAYCEGWLAARCDSCPVGAIVAGDPMRADVPACKHSRGCLLQL